MGVFGDRADHLDDCGGVAGGGLDFGAVTHDVAAAARAQADIAHEKPHAEALAG